jgi:prepilin-type N-terminal cleavage/methylation domain-containing protein
MKYTENTKATQSGMTLIELSVVLLVMVGLAGVAAPYVAGMADKAHDSTTAASLNALNQAFGSYKTNHNALPDKLELLTTTDGSGAVIDYLIHQDNYSTSPIFSTTDTNSNATLENIKLSLVRAGIKTVFPMNGNNAITNNIYGKVNHTFDAANTSPAAAVDLTDPVSDPKFAYVAGSGAGFWGGALSVPVDAMAYALGGSADQFDTVCHSYIAMGIGDKSTIVGKDLQSAPVLFASNGDFNPQKKYARFIGIFQVHSATPTPLEAPIKDSVTGEACADQVQPAKFLGAVADMDFGAMVGSAASQQWSTSSSRRD